MNVRELTFKGAGETVALACGTCGEAYQLTDRGLAERCCKCDRCDDKPDFGPAHLCKKHYAEWRKEEQQAHYERERADDQRRFEKAAKVSWRDYDGPVYIDLPGVGGSPGNGYFYSARELFESCVDSNVPVPEFCWATYPMKIYLDAESILESALEEFHEDAIDCVDVKALQAALDEWCGGNDPGSFMMDFEKAVLLEGIESEHGKPDESEEPRQSGEDCDGE